MKKTFDYIIAGGGSAGCTLASRLSENKDIKVLLIEAGGSGKSLFTQMPGGNGYIFGNPKFDWGFESIPQPSLNSILEMVEFFLISDPISNSSKIFILPPAHILIL